MSSREASYKAVHRILSMIRILESSPGRRMSVAALAERLEVSERTVDRYAGALCETFDTRLGAPILTTEGRGAARAVRLTRELLDHEERGVFRFAAVRAATLVLTAGAGSILGDSAEDAVELLRDTLSSHSRRFIERAEKAFCYVPFGPKDLRVAEDLIDRLLSATIYRRVAEVTRRSRSGQVVIERLEPYSLVLYRDGLYLLARRAGGENDELRTYALERFDAVEIDRESTFEVPAGFDPSAHFEGRLGIWAPTGGPESLSLAFSPGAAEILTARRWPGPNAWHDADDGRRVLELELPITPELVSWLVSWGPRVEILAPDHLRLSVAAELRGALALYSNAA